MAIIGLPHFFGTMFMAAPIPPMSKSRFWLVTLGLLSVSVIVVMAVLGYLLLTLKVPAGGNGTPTATATSSLRLNLPTAPPPTATPGPPPPQSVSFAAEEPIKGFSNCEAYGFKGVVTTGDGDRLPDVQIVVWEDQAGLLALNSTDMNGSYLIEVEDKPAQRKLWVQVYENDLPVSKPVLVETQIDCRNGFQFYQINWREVGQ
jgi:hypothetical protein